MRKVHVSFVISGILLFTFTVFTFLLLHFDVKPIGVEQSRVGFAMVNEFIFDAVGVNLLWYKITDLLGMLALLVVIFFGMMGVRQWIQRKSLLRVDKDIIALGLLYFLVMAVYVFFEIHIVNYRPIRLDGHMEASYPSSHVMIVLTVLGTAIIQIQKRMKGRSIRKLLEYGAYGTIILTLAGRLISGVHWFTDIIAGVLLGSALLMFYKSVVELKSQ
jgi:undecaprenyl-diphosphatase